MTVLLSAFSEGVSGVPNQVLDYSAITEVPSDALTTIATYTAGTTKRIHSIILSGSMYAKFYIIVNGATIVTVRTGPERNLDYYLNITLNAGQVLETKVWYTFPGVGDALFNSTILGY